MRTHSISISNYSYKNKSSKKNNPSSTTLNFGKSDKKQPLRKAMFLGGVGTLLVGALSFQSCEPEWSAPNIDPIEATDTINSTGKVITPDAYEPLQNIKVPYIKDADTAYTVDLAKYPKINKMGEVVVTSYSGHNPNNDKVIPIPDDVKKLRVKDTDSIHFINLGMYKNRIAQLNLSNKTDKTIYSGKLIKGGAAHAVYKDFDTNDMRNHSLMITASTTGINTCESTEAERAKLIEKHIKVSDKLHEKDNKTFVVIENAFDKNRFYLETKKAANQPAEAVIQSVLKKVSAFHSNKSLDHFIKIAR